MKISGTPTTPEKNAHTVIVSCAESLSGPDFSPSAHTSVTHTHTHTQPPLRLQPGRRPLFLSCTSPLCPAEGTAGLPLPGLSQKFPLKLPSWPVGVSGGLRPSPFLPVTAPAGRSANAGGWHGLWTLGLGLPPPPPPAPPALRLCIPLCLCAVVSPGLRAPCDLLNDSTHCLCHVRLCKCNYMCVSRLHPASGGHWVRGNKTCLDLSLSGRKSGPTLETLSESPPSSRENGPVPGTRKKP